MARPGKARFPLVSFEDGQRRRLERESGPEWAELEKQPGRPRALTQRRMGDLKEKMAGDAEFWGDLLRRHGLAEKRLEELESGAREHAIGNFWGMLMQAACETGMKV